MKNRAKFKLANPAQANSVQKLILNKKLSSEEASEERKNRLYSQSLKSPVIKGFRYKGGHLAHWQYASSAIPPEDEEDELAAMLTQNNYNNNNYQHNNNYWLKNILSCIWLHEILSKIMLPYEIK